VAGVSDAQDKERILQRRRIKQVVPLDPRLLQRAQHLREEAKSLPPGLERENLIRRARQAEITASDVSL
jgi:hypothetical protein